MSVLTSKKPRLLSMNRGQPIYLDSADKVLLPVFKCGYTSSHAAYSSVGKVLASFNDLIDYEDVEKVALIRNPYARIVSLYTCKNNRDRLHEFSDSFDKFVDNVSLLLENGYIDGHYNTLIENLSIQGKFIPDKVFKLEQLDELIAYLGVDSAFPKRNESKKKAPWQSYYTDHSKAVVDRLYGADIEMFEYNFI
jgi:hypothetical protein